MLQLITTIGAALAIAALAATAEQDDEDRS